MERIPYTNTRPHAVHIGSAIVRPGETRMVDPRDVPGGAAQAAAPVRAAPDEALLALLDGNVAEVSAALPGLDDAQLDALEAAEVNGKTRKGVLAAIAEERVERETLRDHDPDGDDDGENDGADDQGGEDA